jgi:hypothetical protein
VEASSTVEIICDHIYWGYIVFWIHSTHSDFWSTP